MATGFLSPIGLILQAFSDQGVIGAGYLIHTYVAGSTTPIPTYTDSTLSVANTNPIVLRSNGRLPSSVWAPAGALIKMVMTDSFGNAIPGATIDNLPGINDVTVSFYPRTPNEIAAGVTPVSYLYPPGNPRRYGALGNGSADDTAPVQTALDLNSSVTFNQGDNYSCSSVTFHQNQQFINMNAGEISGNATTATDCIVAIKGSFCTIIGYQVNGGGNGGSIPSPNPNYASASHWYNSSGGSQFNVVLGMLHSTCQRTVVYGANPGSVPTGGLQSENTITGFRTIGCSNPFYSNAEGGVISFSDPIFYTGFENWTVSPVSTARALENYGGEIFAQGGEMEYASTTAGFAADLQNCVLVGMGFETAPPIQIIGPGVELVGCGISNTASTTSAMVVAAGTTGTLLCSACNFIRAQGTGAFSRQPMIDASNAGLVTLSGTVSSGATSANLAVAWAQPGANVAAGTTFTGLLQFSGGDTRLVTFTQGSTALSWTSALSANSTAIAYLQFSVVLQDCTSTEWGWALSGANCRLVAPNPALTVCYKNHRMNITQADPNVYVLNTQPMDSMIPELTLDYLGYTTTGWTLNINFGGGTTLAASTLAGPAYKTYLAAQLTLTASGAATAQNGDPTSLTTIKSSMQRVRPGELYWISGWINQTSGTSSGLAAMFYSLTGSQVTQQLVSDVSALGANGTWTFIEGPITVPATAAYMAPAVYGSASVVAFTDMRVRRAS